MKSKYPRQNMKILKQQRSVGKLGVTKQKLRMIKILTKKDNLMKQVYFKTQKSGFTEKYVAFYCHEC